jgi:hypothetical protein
VRRARDSLLFALALVLVPTTGARACACGCGIFDIDNLFTDMPGGVVYSEYDYMDQNLNWSGLSHAPAANNSDKDIRTSFYTLGGQYLFASGFGVSVEVPYWDRHFATVDGTLMSFNHAALGDVRLTAAYSGFSERDIGVTFGVKLPTGDFTYPNFDRDTEVGSGSTDLMIGAYQRGAFDPLGNWRYFAQARLQFAVSSQGGYRPGDELDGVTGVSYDAGVVWGVDIAPTFQLLTTLRHHDSGASANPLDSGYSRILLSPGVDLGFENWIVHAEVDVPVFQNMIGNQLTAPLLVKASVAYAIN